MLINDETNIYHLEGTSFIVLTHDIFYFFYSILFSFFFYFILLIYLFFL